MISMLPYIAYIHGSVMAFWNFTIDLSDFPVSRSPMFHGEATHPPSEQLLQARHLPMA